jgi:hypothetical protein
MRITNLAIGFLFLTLFSAPMFSAEIINSDRPVNGNWDFKMEKVWHIDGTIDDGFAQIRQISVADSGRVFVHDRKQEKYFVYSPEGKLISSFGRAGEGPGEIKAIRSAAMFPMDNQILIADMNFIHYFSEDGKFLRSTKSSYNKYRPTQFVTPDQFISAPYLLTNLKDNGAKVKHFDLKSRKETVISDFKIYEGGILFKNGIAVIMVFPSITPMMITAYHDGKVYFGMNDKYTINVSDLTGKPLNAFGIKRKPKIVHASEKQKLTERRYANVPKDMQKEIVKKIPNVKTFFSHMGVHSDHLFVLISQLGASNSREWDIFSLAGKYLYRAKATVDVGYSITGAPVIKDGFMYLSLQDEEGEMSIAKYKISLPSTK